MCFLPSFVFLGSYGEKKSKPNLEPALKVLRHGKIFLIDYIWPLIMLFLCPALCSGRLTPKDCIIQTQTLQPRGCIYQIGDLREVRGQKTVAGVFLSCPFLAVAIILSLHLLPGGLSPHHLDSNSHWTHTTTLQLPLLDIFSLVCWCSATLFRICSFRARILSVLFTAMNVQCLERCLVCSRG